MLTETITWHSVADRLPDDEIAVLTAFEDGEVLMGWHVDGGWIDSSGMPVSGVSHWSELPAGPREE